MQMPETSPEKDVPMVVAVVVVVEESCCCKVICLLLEVCMKKNLWGDFDQP
jgi:hypothetical protein